MTKKLQIKFYIEKVAIVALLACLIALCLYALMIRSIMINASVHESVKRTIVDESGRLGELEFEYITLKQSVTLERASELGFTEASPVFVKAPVKGVSLNNR